MDCLKSYLIKHKGENMKKFLVCMLILISSVFGVISTVGAVNNHIDTKSEKL